MGEVVTQTMPPKFEPGSGKASETVEILWRGVLIEATVVAVPLSREWIRVEVSPEGMRSVAVCVKVDHLDRLEGLLIRAVSAARMLPG